MWFFLKKSKIYKNEKTREQCKKYSILDVMTAFQSLFLQELKDKGKRLEDDLKS